MAFIRSGRISRRRNPTSHFYKPQPMRSPEEIRADILALEEEAAGLLDDVLLGGTLSMARQRDSATSHAIEALPEVFIRVNFTGASFSRVDFAMSKIAVNETCGGNPPERDFAELAEHCNGGTRKEGGITDMARTRANLHRSCVSASLLDGDGLDYGGYPEQPHVRMARKTRTCVGGL